MTKYFENLEKNFPRGRPSGVVLLLGVTEYQHFKNEVEERQVVAVFDGFDGQIFQEALVGVVHFFTLS